MRALILGVFLSFCLSIQAQQYAVLSGTVTDAAGGAAMQAVSISANRKSGTITGEDGSYFLRLPAGKNVLEYYYVGYVTVVREVNIPEGGSMKLDVLMHMDSRTLEEVVVSAAKFEQKLSEVTVSMEVLKPRSLSSQNITSLDMILERTSGISILNGQPSIRGGSGFSYGAGSRVLMLVDDLPMMSGDAGDIKWSYLPVENVNQVEIIKGASSVLYGSSALNGVINLRTRFPGSEPETEITLFSGMYMNPARRMLVWKDRPIFYSGGSFSHLRKIGNMDLSYGGSYLTDEGYREMEYEHRIRGNLAWRYRFENVKGLSVGLSSSMMYTDHSDFLLWQNADSGAYRQNPDTYIPVRGTRINIDPYVEYYSREGNRHSLRLRMYDVGNNTLDEDKSSFSRVWYAEYRYLLKSWKKLRWTSGISFMHNLVRAGLYSDHRSSNSSLFSQADATLLKGLKFSAGVRWEINTLNREYFRADPVLRAGLNFQAAGATHLRISFGQGYRFPSIAEKFVDTQAGALNIFPNPELGSEQGWSFEAGIRQGFALGSWQGFADLAVFLTRYRDMIEYTFGYYPPDNPTEPPHTYVGFKAQNIETARIAGAELTFSGQGKAGPLILQVSAGYTLMDPVDPVHLDSSGRTADDSWVLKYRRRHLLKSDLEIAWRSFFTGINLQYNSRMINVDEAFTDPVLGELIMPGFPAYWEEEAGSYVLMDLRAGWNINSALRLNLLLKNVANVEYLGRPGDLGPPRRLSLQLRLTF